LKFVRIGYGTGFYRKLISLAAAIVLLENEIDDSAKVIKI
jgi:hypothetical protein